MLLLTLRGTPTLYYGDEIGMRQVAIAPDQVQDPFEKNVPGIGVGRDGCRTPMQWDARHAGFSTRAVAAAARTIPSTRTSSISARRRDLDPQPLPGADRACAGKSPLLPAGDYLPLAAEGDLLLYRRQSAKATRRRAQPGRPADFDASGCHRADGEILLLPRSWTARGEKGSRAARPARQ